MTPAQQQKLLTERLDKFNINYKKLHGNLYQKGLPDLLIYSRDNLVFVECKINSGVLTKLQQRNLIEIPFCYELHSYTDTPVNRHRKLNHCWFIRNHRTNSMWSTGPQDFVDKSAELTAEYIRELLAR